MFYTVKQAILGTQYQPTLMRNLHPILILILVCALATACKKDPPIYPNDPGFVPYKSKSANNVTQGATVDISLLAGEWPVTAMYTETYTTSNVLQSSSQTLSNFYSAVEINSNSKSYFFDAASNAPSPGFYTTATSGSNVYLQLQKDPFNRSLNDKIQITNLTATSMTWVAIDPQVLSTASGSFKTGFKVVYKRKS